MKAIREWPRWRKALPNHRSGQAVKERLGKVRPEHFGVDLAQAAPSVSKWALVPRFASARSAVSENDQCNADWLV
jgi:hypothetical protein